MNITKKAISVGLSAALLASLAATVVAPAVALAANSSTGFGALVPGGSSAVGTLTFAEDSVGQFSNGSFTVTPHDYAGTANVAFDTTSTPTITRNFGVGAATAAYVGGALVVSVTGTDATKIDSFTIGNLKLKATASAAQGAVQFNVTADGVGLSEILYTTTGTVTTGFPGSGVSQTVAVAADTGQPALQNTSTACSPSAVGSVSKLHVAASGASPAEDVTISGVTATTANGIFTQSKPAATVVTQAVCVDMFPSTATVGDAVSASLHGSTATWNAGVSRQDFAGSSYMIAQLGFFDGLLAKNSTVTFTITTPGVTFSTNTCTISNCWDTSMGGMANPTLNGTVTALTFTLPADTVAKDYIEIWSEFDVASTVAAGTAVNIAVSTSPAVAVVGSPVTIAYVGNIVVGVSTVPNVTIGTTNQPAGVITLTESGAGSFTDSAPIDICIGSHQTGVSFASGTNFWAVVTKGDLKLNIGGYPKTQGLLGWESGESPYCIEVLDYTASTVASTIEIHTGSATAPAAGGPAINVWPTFSLPGPIYVDVYSGGNLVASNVVIAMAVFSGSPSASALNQPTIVPGKLMQAAGSIQIVEGAPGGFQPHETLWLCIINAAHNENDQVTWSNSVGAGAPVVTTNYSASGLLAHYNPLSSDPNCIQIVVDTQSLVTLGRITLSNLKYDVVSDATVGPVYVEIYNGAFGGGSSIGSWAAKQQIDQYVSNAVITNQAPVVISADSSSTGGAPFTVATKVLKAGQTITIRFRTNPKLAGQTLGIWIAVKSSSGTWGAYKPHASVVADVDGIATYTYKTSSKVWLAFRAYFKGNASYAPAWSYPAQFGRWM